MTRKSGARQALEVLLFGNQKGGVGKTTHCVHVAAALGEAGRRCLVWDLDANQGATTHLGVHGDSWYGSAEILAGQEGPLDVVLTEEEAELTLPPGVHLIPASRELERISLQPGEAPPALPLDGVEDHYDYVLIDTAPNLTPPTTAGYRSAGWFVLTAFADPLALTGLARAMETLEIARSLGTTPARILGVVFGNVPGSRGGKPSGLEGELLRYAKRRLDVDRRHRLVFSTTISRSVAVPRAQMAGRTLFQTNPGHKIARQYRQLAAEIEHRLDGSDKARR